ncbi:unnamed protein product [Malus baccata var. baccata]
MLTHIRVTLSPHPSTPNPLRSKSFDMHSVVAATEDLFHFILSKKGERVRVFLVRDIIAAADAFLDDEVVGRMFNEKPESRVSLESEEHALVMRVVNGFRYLRLAIKLAPEVWTEMLIRMAVMPDVHKFTLDVVSSLFIHFKGKFHKLLLFVYLDLCTRWNKPAALRSFEMSIVLLKFRRKVV